jgi:septum formation protein
MTTVILASASAARARLLRAAGVDFAVEPAAVNEEALKVRLVGQGRTSGEIAELLAAAKALEVSRRREGLVIGADQTLEFGGGLWSKARDLAETRQQLRRLRGRIFTLHCGVALTRGEETLWREVRSANLAMRAFSDVFLDGYLARNGARVLGCLGGFELEGEGAQLFDEVDGDHFVVQGLILIPLLAALREHGGLAA